MCQKECFGETSFIRLPRIQIESQVIIQRGAWVMSPKSVPRRAMRESDAAYCYRLKRWQRSCGIPSDCFVTIATFAETQERSLHAGCSPIAYKPQFISFKNPFLIRLFEQLCRRANSNIAIEEALPSIHNCAEVGTKKIASELLVQWYAYD